MHKKIILLPMLITYMMLTNYSYGEEVTDERGSKCNVDTAILMEDSIFNLMPRNALAAGYQATSRADNSVALGADTEVSSQNGTAVGAHAKVFSSPGSVALGANSVANRSIGNITEALSNKIIDSNGEVSIGNGTILRQITHIAGGTEDTDAANIRQLRALDNKINALDNAHQHEEAAKTNATTAQSAANTASESAGNAQIALDNTRHHEEAAKTSAATAQSAANTASESAGNAQIALDNTRHHEEAAKTNAATAQSAANTAGKSASNAQIALDNTRHHEEAAKTNAATAQSAANTAGKSASNAQIALDNTRHHEEAAKTNAATAQSAANTAGESASNAQIALENTRHYEADFKTAVESTQHSAESTHVSARQAQVLVGQLEGEIAQVGKMTKQAPDGTIDIGHNLAGSTISIKGEEGDRILTDVADGVRDHDVANISQLNNVRRMATVTHELAYENALRMNELQYELSKTNKKIAHGLASSAALTGLFQPYNVGKINFTAGFGRYDTTTAIAVGTGYRFNTHAAVKAGFAYSGKNNFMYNASFNLEW